MAFFSFTKKSSAAKDETKAPRPSVRELQARAYGKWVSQGQAEPEKKRRNSGFEDARAARAATQDNAVVMSY